MPLQHADKPKQPGETLRYSMTFVPGDSIASGDSLSGIPTVTIADYPGGTDRSGTMIEVGSVSRASNVIYVKITGGTDGNSYKITFKCGTTNGEVGVEEDLIIQVREY